MNSPLTINPYLLAEQISDEPIVWEEELLPRRKQLADLLGLNEEDLFDISNPVIYRYDYERTDGKVKKLTELEQLEQLITFLDEQEALRKEACPDTDKDEEEPDIPEASIKEVKEEEASKERKERIIRCLLETKVSDADYKARWVPEKGIWAGKGHFFNMAPEVDDPTQGALGDCYLIAALASVIWSRPYSIVNRASIYECEHCDDDRAGNIAHQIPFYSRKAGESVYSVEYLVEVSDMLPVREKDHGWIYARSYDENETWPALYEKAYAKLTTFCKHDNPAYQPLNNGWIHTAMAQLVGGTPVQKLHAKLEDASLILRMIQENCAPYDYVDEWGRDGFRKRTINPMGAVSWNDRLTKEEYQDYNLSASHCYSILGWDYEEETDRYFVVLRNPWGYHNVIKDVKSGEWLVTSAKGDHGFSIPLNVDDPTRKKRWSGIFAMELKAYFRAFYSTCFVKPVSE